MSSQQFPRAALPPGAGPGLTSTDSSVRDTQPVGSEYSSREVDHSQDPPPGISSGSAGGIASFRDDKQETVVVRPYPQVQALGQPPALPQHVPIQPSPPVTVAAPSVQLLQGQQSSFSEGSVKSREHPLTYIKSSTGRSDMPDGCRTDEVFKLPGRKLRTTVAALQI